MSKATFNRFAISALCCASTTILMACGGGGGSAPEAATAAQAGAPAATVATATDTTATGTTATTTTATTTTTNTAAAPAPAVQAPAADKAAQAGSSTAPAAIPEAAKAPAPAAETPVPHGQNAADYKLSFNEDFNSFNSNLWNDKIWYETGNATKNYTVEDGKLKIWPQRDASGKFFNRTIDTDGKFYQTYGYFEIEAKLPVGKGTWPAFWLFNHINERRPEMDVMEAYAGGDAPWGFKDANGVAHPQAYAPTVWKGDREGQLVGTRQYDTGMDLSAGFHTYAVKWEPNKQTYYFDGKEVLVLNTTFSDPMYLMLDLWYGSASGTPDDSTPQGKQNSFEVNYVRAWTFK